MPNNLTNNAENRVLDWLNPDVAAVRPTGPLKLRLYLVMPNQETGTGGTPVSLGSYADTTIVFAAAANGVASTSGVVNFPTATADQGEVVGMGILDSAGLLIALGELGQSKSILNGEIFSMPAGSISLSLTAATDNLTDTWENRALDWLLVTGSPTRPTSPLRVRLYSLLPDQETGAGGTAITGFAYADTAIVFDIASSGATSNTSATTFPNATGGDWGEVLGIAIRENGGTPVWIGAFNVSKIVIDGQGFQLPAGSTTLSLD